MPRRLPTIRVVPEVLVWARESAGLSQAELSRKIRSERVDIKEWERSGSETLVTASQLENIADAVKRPSAALLLNAPPQEPPLPKDFRRPQRRTERYSIDLSRAIRRARRLQRIAAEVFRTLGQPVESDLPGEFRLNDDPNDVANEIRELVGIPRDIHMGWRDVRTALREWRSIVEDRNILVLSAEFARGRGAGVQHLV